LGPQNKTSIPSTDGKRVWDFDSITKQLIIDYYRPDQTTLLPKNFMYEFPRNYNAVYRGEAVLDGRKCHMLHLTPKEESLTVVSIRIWVDGKDWLTRQIQFEDYNTNVTTYHFRKIILNSNLPVKTFTPPDFPDIRIVDLTSR